MFLAHNACLCLHWIKPIWVSSISLRRESEFSHYCWELLRKHVGLSSADILPGHWLGGWKVVSCHSSAQSSSHEWACIAALERLQREAASPVWLYFYSSHRKERRRCRWTYIRWAMHTIHGLCRLCIERNLPQVCSFVLFFYFGCIVIDTGIEPSWHVWSRIDALRIFIYF